MFGKGTKVYSVLHKKCPRCQEGDFFQSYIYDLGKVGDVKEECDKCGLKYEKEPGFYYGVMYVSYALAVATFVTLWVSINLFFKNVSTGWQIAIIIAGIILLAPLLFSMSKIIWANMFISYEGKDRSESHGAT